MLASASSQHTAACTQMRLITCAACLVLPFWMWKCNLECDLRISYVFRIFIRIFSYLFHIFRKSMKSRAWVREATYKLRVPRRVPRGSEESLRGAFGNSGGIFERWELFLNIFLHGCCWVALKISFSNKLLSVCFVLTYHLFSFDSPSLPRPSAECRPNLCF